MVGEVPDTLLLLADEGMTMICLTQKCFQRAMSVAWLLHKVYCPSL